MTAPTRSDLTFDVAGDRVHAWHYVAASDALQGPHGRPVVVMAHGVGGTKDSGLEPFATVLAAAGCELLAFDYRGFGASEGSPRQAVVMRDQAEDYRAAIVAAKQLPDVDPSRVVLWGVSLSGGHVLTVAAGRDDLAAVVSLTPLVDGVAAGRLAMKAHRRSELLANGVNAVASRLSRTRMIPLVALPGEPGCMTLDGCLQGYTDIAGPTWRNEIDAAIGIEVGRYRPIRDAGRISCPVLVQIADFDRFAPPHAAAKAAARARATVRHYPCDHFDVWGTRAWHATSVRHQVDFLRQHLQSGRP